MPRDMVPLGRTGLMTQRQLADKERVWHSPSLSVLRSLGQGARWYLQRIPPLFSPMSKRQSKLDSDLPLHVRTPQTSGTAHTSSRRRQAAIIIASIVTALVFCGFFRCCPVHRSRNAARNPAYLIKAKSGAVASENIMCSDIGVDVMKDGGNAVDAAVATTFCIGVVNMFS